MATKSEKIYALFNPNEAGESGWITVEQIVAAGIKWSKNGEQRHGVFFNRSELNWLVKRRNNTNTGTILALKMDGFNSEPTWRQTISLRVQKHFTDEAICNLSLLSIPAAQRNIDHRYGNKSHADYIKMYKVENQKVEDFQLIFSVLNNAKREVCRQCCQSGIRPEHPTLGFVEGDSSHSPRFPCSGCFLAEPERYRELSE